jgi:potassium efflux system protein
VLIHKAEDSLALHLVLEGRITAIQETDRISRQLFSFGEAEFFGEQPHRLPVAYPTSMWATEDSLVFDIPSGSFRELLAARPDFSETVSQAVARFSDVRRSDETCLPERGLLDDVDLVQPLQRLRDRLREVLSNQPCSRHDQSTVPCPPVTGLVSGRIVEIWRNPAGADRVDIQNLCPALPWT